MAELGTPVSGDEIKTKLKERGQYLEVLVPNEFTQWPAEPGFSGHKGAVIPILQLSHVTHEKEAKSIEDSNYTFAPKMKLGKSFQQDGSPFGETYKQLGMNIFQKIPRSFANPIFPGYLSWWGIDVRSWYETTDEGRMLSQRIHDHKSAHRYAPSYLDVGSQYGNKAFSVSLPQILNDYRNSRENREVYLRIGGTLRYRHEICYVIIVCTEQDLNLADMPSLTKNNKVDASELVNGNGMVVNYDAIPQFKVQSIVKTEYIPNKQYYNWEQLAFAFYYPAPMLQCTSVELFDVAHDKPGPPCFLKGQSVCPNDTKN